MSQQAANKELQSILRPRTVRAFTDLPSRSNGPVPTGYSSALKIHSSRSNTPLPEDAQPSAHAVSKARQHARATAKKRIFHTINYQPRTSHFDPRSEYRDFRGFFVLFWIGLGIIVITTALRNIKETGFPLQVAVYELFTRNIVSLAIADFAMVGSTILSLYLHQAFHKSNGILRWKYGGIMIQSIYQLLWVFVFTEIPFQLNWTWTAQVFFALHTLTFLMKMHSYAFYNGHLSETAKRLVELDIPGRASTAPMHTAVRYPFPASPSRLREISTSSEGDEHNLGPAEEQDEQRKQKQDLFKNAALEELRGDLATELTSPMGNVTYPQNLTLLNYLDYIICPTLCYELEYPRTTHIRWLEVFYKTAAVFGCIFLMTVISENFVTPVLADASVSLGNTDALHEKALILADTISVTLFPFMMLFLLTFLVIWEYTLGAFAELSCFADRHFYSDWWNCEDWLEFSREWNIPVYNFLKRHVYFASKAYTNDLTATFVTFFISALGHELIMGCISKKMRGYSMFSMMLQLPLTAIQRTKYVKGRWVLNNSFFWGSIVLGISAIASLYVLV